jgi:hypothetical protein
MKKWIAVFVLATLAGCTVVDTFPGYVSNKSIKLDCLESNGVKIIEKPTGQFEYKGYINLVLVPAYTSVDPNYKPEPKESFENDVYASTPKSKTTSWHQIDYKPQEICAQIKKACEGLGANAIYGFNIEQFLAYPGGPQLSTYSVWALKIMGHAVKQ